MIAACFVASMVVAGCSTVPAPSTFPEFDLKDAKPLVVVADARPGEILPGFEECKRANVICLHDPMWLKVSVRETLYGEAASTRMAVSTTSHYGFMSYERNRAPRIMVLAVGPKGDVVMPTYSDYPIARRKDGKWFLPIDGPATTWFLPCAIADLKESIDPQQFSSSLVSDDNPEWIRDNPDIFQTIKGKAYPRFAIPIERIRAELAKVRPQADAMGCERMKDD
jgi:hypothetical protein